MGTGWDPKKEGPGPSLGTITWSRKSALRTGKTLSYPRRRRVTQGGEDAVNQERQRRTGVGTRDRPGTAAARGQFNET